MRVVVESNCLELIQAIEAPQRDTTYFHSLVRDCKILKTIFQKCVFKHTKRAGNRVAHHLAKYAYNLGELVWIEDCLMIVASLVLDNCIPLI